MFELHIDEKALRKKIIDLFNYRQFPLLMHNFDSTDTKDHDSFLDKMIALQTSIYHLDAHLEANWVLDSKKLAFHWENIKSNLKSFSIPEDSFDDYLSLIKKYEKHEIELREFKSPLRLNLEYFYFYKSCDVKLLRRLIDDNMSKSRLAKNAEWRYFDLITEVNDDVQDVFEDLDFINGNRFLMTIMSEGQQKTEIIFNQFIDKIKSAATLKWKEKSDDTMRTLIYTQTMEQVDVTKDLLMTQLKTVRKQDLIDAKLYATFYQNQQTVI